MPIQNISAREILNSSATTSLEVTVSLDDGSFGKASVPFGASAGSHEAYVLFDNDQRYDGKGMQKAVNNVNTEIRDALVGKDPFNQKEVDQIMISLDGTENKQRLGANAILGVSLAIAHAAARSQRKELYHYIEEYLVSSRPSNTSLPLPMIVVIEGGKHADNSTDFQEYLIIPDIKNDDDKVSVKESVRAGAEVYLALKKILKEAGLNTNIGNEGAYAPAGIRSNTQPWDYIMDATLRAGYTPGKNVFFAADPACSEIAVRDKASGDIQYQLKKENRFLSSEDMIAYFDAWIKQYPFKSIEDPLAEDDWENWTKATQQLGSSIRIVGDDLLVTNPKRVERAIKEKACNAVLIKLNQIGTLSETIQTIEIAHKAGFTTIVSHRGGGETNDTSMIDLAVACGCHMVKVGIARGERVCKYNRLMEIERLRHELRGL